jgi:hypothetical protein
MSTDHQAQDPDSFLMMRQSHLKRPFLVTLLAVLVLIISCINLIRFIEAIRMWDFLASLPGVSPLYIALTGLIWALVGFPLAWGLWRGQAQAPKATRILTLVFALYYWLDRLLIAQNVNAGSNWLFAAVATVVMILFIFWTLGRSQKYFGTTANQPGVFSRD